MSDERAFNVFISHSHVDDDRLQELKAMLGKNGYRIRNSPIDTSKFNNASNPEYIKYQILAPRIKWAGVMVVLIGPETHESHYVNWEIEYANRCGKRIVGILVRGAKNSCLPKAFEKYGDALVGWGSSQLMGAVKGEHNNWCQGGEPGGEITTSPLWGIERYGC